MRAGFGRRAFSRFVFGAGAVFATGGVKLAWAEDEGAFGETVQPDLVRLLPPEITKSKTITVAVALGSPPDDFRNANGEISGWEIDILKAVAASLGLKLNLRPTTFDALIPGLKSRRFDAAVGQIGLTEVREKVVDMVGTLTGNELFAARAGSDIKVANLDDICGVTVATTRGSREYEFALAHQARCKALGKKPINVLTFNSGTDAADALMSGRAELFWIGSTAVSYFVRQSKGRAKVVGSYTDKAYIGIALPKGSTFVPALQAAIQHLIDDGTYAKIVKKWGLESGAIRKVPVNPKGAPT
ncbi:MAG: ABC transporter substrate-binding protein [Acetobacteraceae bacterium]